MTDVEPLRREREVEGPTVEVECACAAQRRAAFLIEVGRVLASSSDYATTLENIAGLVVPAVGDVCVVLVARPSEGRSEDERSDARTHDTEGHAEDERADVRPPYRRGRLVIEAVRAGPGVETPVREMLAEYLMTPGPEEHPINIVYRTGAPHVVAGVGDAYPAALARGGKHVGKASELGSSLLLIAARADRGRVLGVLALACTKKGGGLGSEDILLAEELGRRAGVAIDNALMYELLQKAEQRARGAVVRAASLAARLRAIAAALAEAVTPVEVAEAAVESTMASADTVISFLVRTGTSGDARDVLAHRGMKDALVKAIVAGRLPSHCVLEEAVRTRSPVFRAMAEPTAWISEGSGADFWPAEISAAAIPLMLRDRLLGVLGVVQHGRCLPDEEREFLLLAGGQVAQAIERAALFEEVGPARKSRPNAVSATAGRALDEGEEGACPSSVLQDTSERQKLRTRLALADQIASLGTLAAGVVHELNNPLAYVIANLDVLRAGLDKMSAAPPEESTRSSLCLLRQAILDAQDGAGRAARIVQDLKTLTRTDQDTRGPADLRAVVDLAVKISAGQARHRARVVQQYGDVPTVEASEARLVQVFINLIVNAAQAIPEGAADKNEIRIVTRTDAEGRAVVEVHDTGGGVPPEIQGRIFEPFFTTKPVGLGTGMGLSICHGIVTAHGGEIVLESRPGAGSVFKVTLPASRARAVESPGPVSASAPKEQRRGRLLIIDDEVKLGRVLVWELSSEHDVEFLTNGEDAFERFRSGERWDLILCDLMMPRMTGMVLYEEIRRLSPAQADRMVFLTGGTFTATARQFLSEIENPTLEKPFDIGRLQALVHDALSQF